MIIIGGGLSGLAATFFAHSRKVADKYVLVEATDRFGGWIRTKKDHLNNYYEVGPSCIQCKGEPFIHTLDLINDLKISNHLICSNWPNPESQINAILHHNKIVPLPNTFLDLFKTKEPFSKPLIYDFAKELLKMPSKKLMYQHDVSIYEFIENRFSTEIADHIFGPIVTGLCAGNSKLITARLFLLDCLINGNYLRTIMKKSLTNMFHKPKSNNYLLRKSIKEKWASMSFQNGLSTLTDALSVDLCDRRSVQMVTKHCCTSLTFTATGVLIAFNNNDPIQTDHVICTLPANKLLPLVQKQFPVLGRFLKTISFSSVVVCYFVYKDLLTYVPFGFSYLVPLKEESPVLKVSFDENYLYTNNPKYRYVKLTLGGPKFSKVSNEDIYSLVKDHLLKTLHITAAPECYDFNTLIDCIPQYNIGHYATVEKLRIYIDENRIPLTLCGSSYDGIGINDVIKSVKFQVNKMPLCK